MTPRLVLSLAIISVQNLAQDAKIERIQLINIRAPLIAAAPDGTVYMAGEEGAITPTPNAYMSVPGKGFLIRISPHQGTVLYATYLNLAPRLLSANGKGQVCIASSGASLDFPITQGTYFTPGLDRDALALIKIDTATGALAYSTRFGKRIRPFYSVDGLILDQDGSLTLSGYTSSQEFPVTPDAFQLRTLSSGTVFLSRISSDGSRLLYSTYLGGAGYQMWGGMTSDPTGRVYLSGMTTTPDFPVTPGAYAGGPATQRTFVARWNPAEGGFDYISTIGISTYSYVNDGIAMAADSAGRVAIASVRGIGDDASALSATPGALKSSIAINEPFILMLNESGSELIYLTGFPALESSPGSGGMPSLRFKRLRMVDTGELLIIANGLSAPTVGAASLSYYGVGTFLPALAKLSAQGTRLAYSTTVRHPIASAMLGADVVSGTFYIAAEMYTSPPQPLLPASFPVAHPVPAPDRRFHLLAVPNVIQACLPFRRHRVRLAWDTRDVSVTAIEVRTGSPDGPLVGAGLTGSVWLDIGAETTFFLQNVSGGRPFSMGNTITTEKVAYGPASWCSSSDGESYVEAEPNPIPTCLDGTGAQALIRGHCASLPDEDGWAEIRVLDPLGPLLTRGRSSLADRTGDWVRNGMPFHLVTPKTAGGASLKASVRVYTLPAFDCADVSPSRPSLAATPNLLRPCGSPATSTLAWFTASWHVTPVEIREGAPDGPLVGRFDHFVGLLDVRPWGSQTYYLNGHTDGSWQPLASTRVQTDLTGCIR